MTFETTAVAADVAYIVLQMGKVGSWTIIKTIQNVRDRIELRDLNRANASGDCIVHTHSVPEVEAWLAQRPARKDVRIVSAVRDPLRLSVSGFFQNFTDASRIATGEGHFYLGSEEDILGMPTQEIVEHFQKNVLMHTTGHIEGFADAFGKLIERDPHSLRFNDRGLAKGRFSAGSFYVMRLHRFDHALPDLGRNVGLNITEILDANVGDEKWYMTKYREFLKLFKPTSSELDMYYDTPFARGYFTSEELAAFRAAWI